ncbi:hypothetical protein HUJ05_008735 [Dendroctonus ponderosae]|nr:hypothetical protein HUJ05_008735 [Dendroctonus ponderosae]
MTKAVDQTIGKTKTKRTKPWFDKEKQQLQKRQATRNILMQHETNENREEYTKYRRQTRQLIRRKKREKGRQKYEMMERSRPRPGSREFYNLISNDRKDFNPRSVITDLIALTSSTKSFKVKKLSPRYRLLPRVFPLKNRMWATELKH